MRPIILEDQHVAVATEASDGDFEVITDPVKALEAIRAGADGIFDVFQPRTNNEELNNLLEKYLEQIHEKGCKQIILQKRCSEEEARKICDKMMAMLAGKEKKLLPYGAAIAYEAAKKGLKFVICSDLHRHSFEINLQKNVEFEFNGWALLSPLAEFMEEEEFEKWKGPHIQPSGSIGIGPGGKESVDTWEEAIERFKE